MSQKEEENQEKQKKQEIYNEQYARGYVCNFSDNEANTSISFDIKVQQTAEQEKKYDPTYIKAFANGSSYEKLKDLNIENGKFLEVSGPAQFNNYKDKNELSHKSNSIRAFNFTEHNIEKIDELDPKKDFKYAMPNRVELATTLVNDIEIINTAKSALAKSPLAINSKWTDKSGEVQESTQYVDAVIWENKSNKMNVLKDGEKGQQLKVVSRVVNGVWTDAKDNKRYKTSLEVVNAKLGKKKAVKQEVTQTKEKPKTKSKAKPKAR